MPPIACRLGEAERAARRAETVESLFRQAGAVEELPDGYALRFPSGGAWIERLVEFIAAERQCCPFFTFELRFEPNDGPIWLSLRGPAGVKDFVRDWIQPLHA